MKESIAQAFIVNLILFFFGILVILYFGSINYSKAYKAKNKIVNTIEKYGEWTDKTKEEVYLKLEQGGYQTVNIEPSKLRENCAKKVGTDLENVVYPVDGSYNGRGYEFCVIKYNSSRGSYYQVVTYMRFEVPLIGSLIHPAIYGETAVQYIDPNMGTETESEGV